MTNETNNPTPPAAGGPSPDGAPGPSYADASPTDRGRETQAALQRDASPQLLRRRRFLNYLTVGLGSASAASVLWAVVGFIFAPIFRRDKETWRPVGKVEDFPVGTTRDVSFDDASSVPWAGYAARTAAWVRRESRDRFVCFSVNCTHLGCPVRWVEGAKLFMCPCHGGVYYRDGRVAAGPPPEPLPRYDVRVRDGKVEIRASGVPITRGV